MVIEAGRGCRAGFVINTPATRRDDRECQRLFAAEASTRGCSAAEVPDEAVESDDWFGDLLMTHHDSREPT
jgi:hypothetical protein